ncbi:alpha/beta hydrolase family protein [Bacteroidota bacterium]
MKNMIILLLLLSNLFAIGQRQTETLPKPTGKYYVGVRYLSFIDNNRKEIFDNKQEKYREITVKSWYPSDIKSDFEPYLLNSESDFVIKYLQFPELYRTLKTNSSRDIPLSSKENIYPVLVFSHGWGEHYSQNSIQMEELASHGYIVFSISRHYECKFSSFPDGRFIYIDMANKRLQKLMAEMAKPESMELLEKLSSAGNDEERLQVFADMDKTLPMGLLESPQYWAEDISFFIDQLMGLNKKNDLFHNKLDLNKIGVFGMSMGGLASIIVSHSDKRIKACLSMDGGLTGFILKNEIKIPAMFLNSERYLGYGNIFTQRSTLDSYSLTVKKSDHYSFTDYSIHPVPSVEPFLGSIDGLKIEKIMNVMILNFFDKYLKGNQNIDLIYHAKLFPEIEIATKIN